MNNVVLRPWQKKDAQELALVANNKNIWNNVRDALPGPYTVMDALQWIARSNNKNPSLILPLRVTERSWEALGVFAKKISRETQ